MNRSKKNQMQCKKERCYKKEGNEKEINVERKKERKKERTLNENQ